MAQPSLAGQTRASRSCKYGGRGGGVADLQLLEGLARETRHSLDESMEKLSDCDQASTELELDTQLDLQ